MIERPKQLLQQHVEYLHSTLQYFQTKHGQREVSLIQRTRKLAVDTGDRERAIVGCDYKWLEHCSTAECWLQMIYQPLTRWNIQLSVLAGNLVVTAVGPFVYYSFPMTISYIWLFQKYHVVDHWFCCRNLTLPMKPNRSILPHCHCISTLSQCFG